MTDLHKCGCGGSAMWNPVETTKPGKPVTYDLNLGYVGCTNCGVRTEGKQAQAVAEAEWNRALASRSSAIVEEPMAVAWAFCPECGCEEIYHEEGRHKQCANCGQEWFDDIDYRDVCAKNLRRLFASPQPHTGRDGVTRYALFDDGLGVDPNGPYVLYSDVAASALVDDAMVARAREAHGAVFKKILQERTIDALAPERQEANDNRMMRAALNAALTVEPEAGEVK